MCARMRKVRLLVLPGALLVKVSLSLGDTFGERTFGRKKRYSSIQRRGLKTLTKGLAFIPRDIFFLNIITHTRGGGGGGGARVFFFRGGFFHDEFLVWARQNTFWFAFCEKKVLRYVLWAFSISFVDTQ